MVPPNTHFNSRGDVPQSQRAVPRSRECKLSIGADNDVRDKVVVSPQGFLGYAVVCLLTSQCPRNNCLV